jgi:hypothetical protein
MREGVREVRDSGGREGGVCVREKQRERERERERERKRESQAASKLVSVSIKKDLV